MASSGSVFGRRQHLLPDWQFTREPDAQTGYDELVVRARS
jgi:hypothetical protein